MEVSHLKQDLGMYHLQAGGGGAIKSKTRDSLPESGGKGEVRSKCNIYTLAVFNGLLLISMLTGK